MKLGSAIIVLLLGAPVGPGLGLGCGPRATPVVQPDERPPLPPSSGTPIGHLVDGAGELKLSDDQLDKLRVINADLGRQLEADDREMRPDPVPGTSLEEKPRGLGFRAGGQNIDGSTGLNEAFPSASSSTGAGDGEPMRYVIPAPTVNQVYQHRARHVRDAVRRALALLDAEQQVIARRMLTERGVNLDTGEISGEDPGVKLEEPTLGRPLPREP